MPGLLGQTSMLDAHLYGDIAARCRQMNGAKSRGARRGAPDRSYYNAGQRGAGQLHIEFKIPGAEPRQEQVEEHARLRTLGHQVLIVHTEEEHWAALLWFFGDAGLDALRWPLAVVDVAVDALGFPKSCARDDAPPQVPPPLPPPVQ